MTWIAWTLAAFPLSAAGHAMLSRIPLPGNAVAKFLGVGGVVGLILVMRLFYRDGLSLPLLAAIALYAFLCELYIFAFTFVISSVSVAILCDLKISHVMRHTNESNGEEMTARRLRRLKENGFLIEEHGRYLLTKKGRFLVSSMRFLRRTFRHES
jgi:predicted transcriptional regulator